MVSVDEIKKTESITTGEEVKTQETFKITPQVTSVQPSQPIVVYQRKEIESFTISTLMQDTPILENAQAEKDKVEIVGADKIEKLGNDGTQG